MHSLPASLAAHRVAVESPEDVVAGEVRFSPVKSTWFLGMALAALVGGLATFTWSAFALFVLTTAFVLLFGHSLGSHRKLIHDSFECPRWLEYALVYCGVQVGLAGPLGLVRQHELRDFAQRLPRCHDYLRHGRPFWIDAWWQLNCELHLADPPVIRIEARISDDGFYRFLQATWMAQQLPWAVLFYLWGGWAFVYWGVCARVTAGVFGHWLIGYLAHNHGGAHHEVVGAAVQGRNVRFTSFLTMGESWHNNHHAFPGSARLGLYPGEWDPGWWMLMLLRRAGWVGRIRLARDLAPRPELRLVGEAAAVSGSEGSSAGPCVTAPLAPLSPSQLRWLLGPAVELRIDPNATRLRLHGASGSDVTGLPALCRAIAARGSIARVVAALALPIAAGFEGLRSSLDVQ